MATHSSVLAWRIPGTLLSMGSHRVGHDWIDLAAAAYILSPLFLDFLPIWVTTEHCVEFPEPHSRFSLVIYFIHSIDTVYMSYPVSQFTPSPLSPLRSASDFYVSISALIRLIIEWNVCQPPTLTLCLYDNWDSQAWWNSLKIFIVTCRKCLNKEIRPRCLAHGPSPPPPSHFCLSNLQRTYLHTCTTCPAEARSPQTPCRHRPPWPGLGTQASLSSLQRMAWK